MSYLICVAHNEPRFETVDHAEELTTRLAELGVVGPITIPGSVHHRECEQWVSTSYDAGSEWPGELLVIWTHRPKKFYWEFAIAAPPDQRAAAPQTSQGA